MNIFHLASWKKSQLLDFLFVTYILTLIVLLIMPTEGTIKLSKYFLGVRTDHFIHASLFLPVLPYFRLKLKTKINIQVFFNYFTLAVLFAISCECLQLLVPYRSFDPADILANVIGVTLGGIAFLWKSEPKNN